MRKLFLFPAVLLIMVIFQSCSKQSSSDAVAPMITDVVNATIAPNGSYQLPIDNSGNVSISKQASHFQVSRMELDSKTGITAYKYIPAADYRGTDEVVLSNTITYKITDRSGGCSRNNNSTGTTTSSTYYTTIKINITN